MQFVDTILYRHITYADFTNIESVKKPEGGGGQTYIDIAGLDKEKIKDFFANSVAEIDEEYTKTDIAGEYWPAYTAQVQPLGRTDTDLLEVDGRSAGQGKIRNYRIKNQAPNQHRHRAWRESEGFPTILSDCFRSGNKYSDAELHPVIDPLIDGLLVFVVKTRLGKLFSGFVKSNSLPNSWPSSAGLELMFDGPDAGCIKPSKLLELRNEKENPFVISEYEPYEIADFFNEVFMEEDAYLKIVNLLRRKKNVILQGSPGTGKTFAAKRIAYSLMRAKDKSCICSVQFHQNSAYEDYIIGYRPDEETGAFVLQEGRFVEFFDLASKHRDQDFYLIIDEINRANISKVFGEMLMAIECDHRDEEIEFPATKKRRFSVPSNVYIIGMMNTADRGLALIDYALRRRFAFVTMEPAFNNKTFKKMIAELDCPELNLLIEKVEIINHQIVADPSLGPGFRIGHSYFCIDFPASRESVESVIEYELIPLVGEYWFEQLEVAEEAINGLESALG